MKHLLTPSVALAAVLSVACFVPAAQAGRYWNEPALPTVPAGSTITVPANFLGPHPGAVLITFSNVKLPAVIKNWHNNGVTVELPPMAIRSSVRVRLDVILPHGQLAHRIFLNIAAPPSVVLHAVEPTSPLPTGASLEGPAPAAIEAPQPAAILPQATGPAQLPATEEIAPPAPASAAPAQPQAGGFQLPGQAAPGPQFEEPLQPEANWELSPQQSPVQTPLPILPAQPFKSEAPQAQSPSSDTSSQFPAAQLSSAELGLKVLSGNLTPEDLAAVLRPIGEQIAAEHGPQTESEAIELFRSLGVLKK